MSSRPGFWISMLAWGPSNAGKTTLGVSAGWDRHKKQELCRMKWVTFGREDNPALNVPEEMRKQGSTSLRLTSPLLDSRQFEKDLTELTTYYLKQAQQGRHEADVFIFDGLSELDLLEGMTSNLTGFDRWDELLATMYGAMMRTDPAALGAHVIWTARPAVKRSPVKNNLGQVIAPGDPDFLASKYIPSVRGQFRQYVECYFNLTPYLDSQLGQHEIHFMSGKDFNVKNVWEESWKNAGKPSALVNTDFWTIMEHLQELMDTPIGMLDEVRGGKQQA
jgi:hypothetical protein